MIKINERIRSIGPVLTEIQKVDFLIHFCVRVPPKMYGKSYFRYSEANIGPIDLKTRYICSKSQSLQKVCWQLGPNVKIDEVIQRGEGKWQ